MIKLENGAVVRFAKDEAEANRLENKGYTRVGLAEPAEKVPDLSDIKAFAENQSIDIGRATTYEGILSKIQEAGFIYPTEE